jgi:hypothetical protein
MGAPVPTSSIGRSLPDHVLVFSGMRNETGIAGMMPTAPAYRSAFKFIAIGKVRDFGEGSR